MRRQELLPLTTYRWDAERTEDLFPGPRFSELCGNLQTNGSWRDVQRWEGVRATERPRAQLRRGLQALRGTGCGVGSGDAGRTPGAPEPPAQHPAATLGGLFKGSPSRFFSEEVSGEGGDSQADLRAEGCFVYTVEHAQ